MDFQPRFLFRHEPWEGMLNLERFHSALKSNLHESLILEYFLQLVTVTSYTFFLEKKKDNVFCNFLA